MGLATTILNRYSGLDPLSPKREEESLSRKRLRVCARNDGKRPRVVP